MKKCLALLVVLAVVARPLPGEAAGRGSIASVRLAMEKGAISLEGVRIVEGSVKTPKYLELFENRIYFAVSSASGELIYEGVIRDPSKLHSEYADESGVLHRQETTLESVIFSVRIPCDERASSIAFYIVGKGTAAGADGASGAARAAAVASRGRLIGTVAIDLDEARRE
jgi:hypothetical protein